MPDLKLDILVIPTYNVTTLGVADASTYPTNPPVVSGATIEITVPGFGTFFKPFSVNDFNIFTTSNLGITPPGIDQPLPDGVYRLKYSVAPAYKNFVEKSIMRIEQLQEKFDGAFMKLDMMECDRAIKTQAFVDLNTINFFIQGALAAANNCADVEATKMYNQADMMLNNFIKNNCGCSGNNYVINFY
jgi:hypothetical protein